MFDPEFCPQFSTATKHGPAIQIMRKCWVRDAMVAGTRFREPQISEFVARSRVLDNSGVPIAISPILATVPLSPVVPSRPIRPLPNFLLSLTNASSNHTASPYYLAVSLEALGIFHAPSITVLLRRRGRCAAKAASQTMGGFMYEKSRHNAYP